MYGYFGLWNFSQDVEKTKPQTPNQIISIMLGREMARKTSNLIKFLSSYLHIYPFSTPQHHPMWILNLILHSHLFIETIPNHPHCHMTVLLNDSDKIPHSMVPLFISLANVLFLFFMKIYVEITKFCKTSAWSSIGEINWANGN